MTEFFKALTSEGELRLVQLVRDELPSNPLDDSDPVMDNRPLFVLTNHRRYTLGDKDAESLGWDLLQKEPGFDRSWFEDEFDILEQWDASNETWDKVEFRQRPGIGPDGAGRTCVETPSKMNPERWMDVTDYIVDYDDPFEVWGSFESREPFYRWNTEPNPDYLEDDLEGLYRAAERCGAYLLPVYMYDHCGISLSTSGSYPYNALWDSGLLGFIMWTSKQLSDRYAPSPVSSDDRFIYTVMQEYFAEYAAYVEGDVWGYKIYDPLEYPLEDMSEAELSVVLADMEEVDSCWGFIGYGYVSKPETITEQFGLKKVEAL